MKLGARITELLKRTGKTASELARYVDVSPQAVGHWVRGDSEPIGKRREKIAEFFGVSEEELLFGGDASANNSKAPLITWSQAGRWRDTVDAHGHSIVEEWIDVGVPVNKYTFSVEVVGDSMVNPAGWPSFPPGSRVTVEPTLEPRPGDFILLMRAGAREPTLKELTVDAGVRYLKSLNPIYPLLELRPDDIVIGVVREVIARLR